MKCPSFTFGPKKQADPLATLRLPKVMSKSEEKALVKELAEKGYNAKIEEIRKKEYPHMNGSTYLDHAGTTIYSHTLITDYHASLSTSLYGNPHSSNPSSSLSSKTIEKARKLALEFFNADPEEYDIVFTANATQALKLVADGFAGHEGGWEYKLHWDAHTSLVGVRELADEKGYFEDDGEVEEWLGWKQGGCCKEKKEKLEEVVAPACCKTKKAEEVVVPACCKKEEPVKEMKGCCTKKETNYFCASAESVSASSTEVDESRVGNESEKAFCCSSSPQPEPSKPEVLYCFPEEEAARFDPPKSQRLGLFAWPAQSNFSGRRLPTAKWCQTLRAKKPFWYSLVDAASYAMTSPIDITSMQPDFVAISFYKIFGYPDLGGLLVRKSTSRILRSKRFFGGGTIAGLLISEPWHDKKGNPSKAHQFLEDGTLPFHSILALTHAIPSHTRILGTMPQIAAHVNTLACYLHDQLSSLTHPSTASPLLKIYTPRPTDPTTQGGIIMFNVLSPSGTLIPFTSIELDAIPYSLHLRSGRHCNLGGVQKYLSFSTDALKDAFRRGLRCNGFMEIRVEGRVIGAVRVSLGGMTTLRDCVALLRFLRGVYEVGDGCERALKLAETEEGRAPKGCCG